MRAQIFEAQLCQHAEKSRAVLPLRGLKAYELQSLIRT
jgi:hypothetical protein